MDLARLTSSLTVVKQGLDNLDLQIREELTLCGQLRKKASDQRQHTQQLSTQVEEAREQLFQHEDEQDDLQAVLACLKQQIQQATKRKQDLQDNIKRLSDQTSNLVEQFEHQSDEFCDAKSKNNLLKQEQTIVEQEHDAEELMRAALEKLQTKKQQMIQQQSAVQDLKESIGCNRARIKDIKYQIATESTASNELMLELGTAQHDGPAAHQLVKLKQDLCDREEERINQQCTLAVQEVELGRAEAELKQHQQNLERKKAELLNLNKTIRALGLPAVCPMMGPAPGGSDVPTAGGSQVQGPDQTTAVRTQVMPAAQGQLGPAACMRPSLGANSSTAASSIAAGPGAEQRLQPPHLQSSHNHCVQPQHTSMQKVHRQLATQHLHRPPPQHEQSNTASLPKHWKQQQWLPKPASVQPQQDQLRQQKHHPQLPVQQQQQYYVEEPDDTEHEATDMPAGHHAATSAMNSTQYPASVALAHQKRECASTAAAPAEALGIDHSRVGQPHKIDTVDDRWTSSSACVDTGSCVPADSNTTASRKRPRAQVVVSEMLVSQTLQQGGATAAGDILSKRLLVQEVQESVPSRSGSRLLPIKRTVLVQETKQHMQRSAPVSTAQGHAPHTSQLPHDSRVQKAPMGPPALLAPPAAAAPVQQNVAQHPAAALVSGTLTAGAGGAGGSGSLPASASGGSWAAGRDRRCYYAPYPAAAAGARVPRASWPDRVTTTRGHNATQPAGTAAAAVPHWQMPDYQQHLLQKANGPMQHQPSGQQSDTRYTAEQKDSQYQGQHEPRVVDGGMTANARHWGAQGSYLSKTGMTHAAPGDVPRQARAVIAVSEYPGQTVASVAAQHWQAHAVAPPLPSHQQEQSGEQGRTGQLAEAGHALTGSVYHNTDASNAQPYGRYNARETSQGERVQSRTVNKRSRATRAPEKIEKKGGRCKKSAKRSAAANATAQQVCEAADDGFGAGNDW